MYLGQSAIEYLMTYGWMLLVVAVAGGAVFSVAQDSSIDSINGFSSGNVLIDNFGVTSSDELGLEVRSGSGTGITISQVNISDSSTGEWVYKEFTTDSQVGVASDKIFQIPNVTRTDGANTLNIDVIYDSGGLENLAATGTITGNLQLTESRVSYEGSPEDHEEENGGNGEQTQFYTDFSEFDVGEQPTDLWEEGDGVESWEIDEDAEGKHLNFVGEDSNRSILSFIEAPISSDAEVYARLESDAGDDGLLIRANNRTAPENITAYRYNIIEDGSGQSVDPFIDGNQEDRVMDVDGSAGSKPFNMRSSIIGDNIRSKSWNITDEEPDWDGEATDDSIQGEVGVFSFRGGGVKIYEFGVGIDGEEAPIDTLE